MKFHMRITLLGCSLILILFQFAVYAPALNNAFVHYDDNTYVYENENVKTFDVVAVAGMFARPFFRSYTPLALLSHSIDYALWKENPWGHHFTSLLLHSVNVVLMFLLSAVILSRVGRREKRTDAPGLFSNLTADTIAGAFIAAMLYSVHPMRVESVAWVSDRKDLLLALFLLPAVLAYLRYDDLRGTRAAVKWFIAALVFNVLALLSKSIATVTPLLFLSLDAFLLHRSARREAWKQLILEKTPFLLLSAGFGVLAMWAARGSLTSDIVVRMTTVERALLPVYSPAFYIEKILLPLRLTPIYGAPSTPWMVLGAFLTLLIIAAILWQARKGYVGWLLALCGFALPLLPVSAGLSAGIQPWADRYSYVPSIALFMLVGAGFSVLWRRWTFRLRGATIIIATSAATIFGFMDRQQIGIWKDSETMWRTVVREAPAIPNGYDNLGVALADKGDFDAALEMYRTAIRLQPNYADPYYNAGVIFQARGMRDSAIFCYHRAILLDTSCVDAYINLGNVLTDGGNLEEGAALYERAITLDADNADAYYNLGCTVYRIGNREKALASFKKAILFSPKYASAYNNMGVIFLEENNIESALESFVRAARLGSTEARQRLSKAGYSWK